ncbi:MAG: sugar ABC transporter substrate-binding protein [Spirochaetota bacterium]
MKRFSLVLLGVCVFIAPAFGGGQQEAAEMGCDGEITQDEIEIWWHEGAEAEIEVVEDFVDEFNASQDEVTASLTLVPEADYDNALRGAAASGDLPDVIDTDASFAFSYAWAGDLQPIGECMSDELREDLLPSIVNQGTYADHMWAVGMFDSGLGMYADRSALEEIGVQIPEHPDEAWTVEEFNDILADLRDAGWEQPLDLKKNYGLGEYYSYLYQPFLWSAGTDLLADDFSQADGYINSEEAVEALTHFQNWHEEDYVDDNEDDAAFVEGRSVLSMVGHWEYSRYKEALGDDLVVLPLPDFGEGTRSGQGSWQWAVNADSDADAAWKFIEFTLEPEQMERMSDASGALPARASVAEDVERFGPGGDLELFRIQLEEGYTVPRPPHPAYPTISSAFNQAIHDIIDGADVEEALDEAAEEIDSDIEANEGYPPPEL